MVVLIRRHIFSLIYGDKNDGFYESRGYGKNYYIVHPDSAKCLGVVEVEPEEDGGFVWRNFDDFEVDVDFEMEYDTCKDEYAEPENEKEKEIKNRIAELDCKMEKIDEMWTKRNVKDVTAEKEFVYYEKLLDSRCVLQAKLEEMQKCNMKGGEKNV